MSSITIPHIQKMKGREKIVTLSLYTSPMAALCDPLADIILVGDSLGMVLYGFDSTLPVTLDMMIAHGRAVVKESHHALTVIDMPFGSVEKTDDEAIKNCQRVIAETTADAVKIEGGQEMATTIHAITKKGINVMGHVGLLPQRAKQMGGFKTQGHSDEEKQSILNDAIAIANAGVFAMVVEAVYEDVARAITAKISVPTIGIGASKLCDGQVLVLDDILGITYRGRKKPRFVRQFAQLNDAIEKAVKDFGQAVKEQTFPQDHETYQTKK